MIALEHDIRVAHEGAVLDSSADHTVIQGQGTYFVMACPVTSAEELTL
jgi:hypothetical protein